MDEKLSIEEATILELQKKLFRRYTATRLYYYKRI